MCWDKKMFINFFSPHGLKPLSWLFGPFGFLLQCCDSLVSCHFTQQGLVFPLTASHIFSAIIISLKYLGAETVAPWLVWVYGEMWPWPNKTTTKRKSYQVLLYLDSADVIYSLVYEVFSWACWLRSTHFVILEHTRPVTWWWCTPNK